MWTNVNKPTGAAYTKISKGFLFYDDTIAYDSSTNTFDGTTATYTKLAKPTNTSWTKRVKPT